MGGEGGGRVAVMMGIDAQILNQNGDHLIRIGNILEWGSTH